jgi:hypothetical protein
MDEPGMPTRRRFLVALAASALTQLRPSGGWAHASDLRAYTVHPDPRPGITAANVLTTEQLADARDLIGLYDSIRKIPHIVDGIGCYCGCARNEGYRSLLICYEQGGMAKHCEICQGQGRLAYRRWSEGQSLEQIRRAIDARYKDDDEAEQASRAMQHVHRHR